MSLLESETADACSGCRGGHAKHLGENDPLSALASVQLRSAAFDEPTRRHDDEQDQQTRTEEGSTGLQEASLEVSEAGKKEVSQAAEKGSQSPTRPRHSWRISAEPGKSKHYWAVGVFDTLDQLNAWCDLLNTDRWSRTRLGGRRCLRFAVAIKDRASLGWAGSGSRKSGWAAASSCTR